MLNIDVSGADKQLASSEQLNHHAIPISFFPDRFAASKDEEKWTLPDLAGEIHDRSEKRKARLPWLKLARFGEVRSAKNCLRTDANTQEVTGLEIDYDAGTMPFDDAIAVMKAAAVRCLVYTSASYIKGEREKWRVLAPFSKGYPPAHRAEMVAVVNGILGGVAAAESFVLSTAFYYGSVNHNPAHRVEVIDGDFVDLRPDLRSGAIGRAGKVATQAHIVHQDNKAVSPGRDDAEILQLLKDSRKKNPHGGGQWHNSMLPITATMIGRGWSDAEIFSACAEYCDGHWGDEELAEMIESGRAKWKAPDPDKVMNRIAPVVAAAIAAKGGEIPDFAADFPTGTTREDYYAFLPTHQYIYKHTGRLYPLATINATLNKVTVGSKPKKQTKKQLEEGAEPEAVEKKIPASLWLDRNRPVMEMSWAPGEPQLIEGRLAHEGGWIERAGVSTFNLYQPPVLPGGSGDALQWLLLVRKLYGDHANHIVRFCAHRIQRPAEKINHALVLTGSPGIGKDTLLEPLKYGVGACNFREVSPQNIVDKHNDFVRSVVLRVSEARDLGDVNRYALYETMKTLTAAPPDMLRVDAKYVPQYYVANVTAVIVTTNYPSDGLYLPADDRRHYVCGTEVTRDDFSEGYWREVWDWYGNGGLADVVGYLRAYDLAAFDAKRPPEKTEAFWRMVDTGRASEVPEMSDALDAAGNPDAVTVSVLAAHASFELKTWLQELRNRRAIPHRFESCGYVPVRNNGGGKDGYWEVGGKRQVVYCKRELLPDIRYRAAEKLSVSSRGEKADQKGNITPFKPR